MVQAGFLLLAYPAAAQIKFDDFRANLSGNVSTGYSADFGNAAASDHNWLVGGDANLSGSYYTPNFVAYDADFYMNQSRANSNFQSITNASGINLNTTIFGGSHFPGALNYSKAYNKEGNYAVPGLANYVTDGNSDTFGVNWSENLPGMPAFSAGYQLGSSQYSVYGTNDEGTNAFHSINLHSGYTVAGFNTSGFYTEGNSKAEIPAIVTGEVVTDTKSNNDAYGFNVNHILPWRGSASSSFNRSTYSSNYLGTSTNGTIDLLNTSAAVHPTNRFSLSVNADYSDNLNGQLIQSVVAAGGVAAGLNSNSSSDSLDLMAIGSFSLETNLQATATVERRTQSFLGDDYGVTSIGGSATYSRKILQGSFNASLMMTENKADKNGQDNLGFSSTENYNTEIRGWILNGQFGYAQNVQTLLVTYMNSYFNYSGNARRKWGKIFFGAGAGASQTGLSSQPGTTSSSQSYNASLAYDSWFTFTGAYSKSSGQALATGAGLVPVPIPTPVLPSSLVTLYGGDGYSFGLATGRVKGLILSSSYSKSISNSASNSVTSDNMSSELNVLMQYQFRKLNLTSGYSRLDQGFSASGSQPQTISSFYIGVSRWFKFF